MKVDIFQKKKYMNVKVVRVVRILINARKQKETGNCI